MYKGKGNLIDVSRDVFTGRVTATVEIDSPDALSVLGELQNEKVSFEFKRYSPKRSLDANAMLWACLQEISVAVRADKWKVYLNMLRRYGKYTYICVKPHIAEEVRKFWRESEIIGEVDICGEKAVQLLVYFGSSMYTAEEFSHLLDGVVYEMQQLGLQSPPSGDILRAIKQLDKKEKNK